MSDNAQFAGKFVRTIVGRNRRSIGIAESAQAGDHFDELVGAGFRSLADSHLLAPSEDADPVGEAEHLVERVADEQDRPAPVAQTTDQLLGPPRLSNTERGCGLVQQHEPLRPEHGARDRHALSLATGQVPDGLRGAPDAHGKLVEQRLRLGRHRGAVLTLILVVCSSSLLACSCAPQTTAQLLASSSNVFLATATNVVFIDQDQPNIEPRIKVQFGSAEKLWKGKALSKLQTVFNKSTCNGFAFETTKRYLVFAYKQDGETKVGACTVFLNAATITTKSAELDALAPPS